MAMTPRHRVRSKLGLSVQRSREESDSSEDSDDSSSSAGSPPPLTSESENDSESEYMDNNETAGKWWLGLNKEERTKRETCIKIHVLSPFLFGIVPQGHEDKLIDWSYECGLLPTKDVQQVVNPTNANFQAIQIVENAYEVLLPFMNKRANIVDILTLRNDIVKCTSYKSALECAEKKAWFPTMRNSIDLPEGGKREMASMALILSVYHFAGHIQLSYSHKNTDVLKRYNEDCKHAEEKALELKQHGNTEFVADNFRAAISKYTRGVGLSPFNYIMYGNRAQSYLNLGNFRQALIDAKRTVILKPDWDKGQYRFKQAANALYNSEGDGASFLTFCVDKEVLCAKTAAKQNGAQAVKQNSETTKGNNHKIEDDSSEESVPELVSADESDTSSGESEREMPDLLDENASDSNESGIDEDDYHKIAAATKKGLMDSLESKRPKKIGKKTLELLRKQKEELSKKEAEKEPESKRVQEKKPEKVEKPTKIDKNKKVKEVIHVGESVTIPERKTQVEGILREGSKALLENSFQEASESYCKALGYIDAGPRKSLGYADKKYVIVLYAYGTSLIGLDIHKELEAAKSTFQNIITSFKTLNFPLAYYGLGRIHHRQNRFPEAIETLEKGLSIIQSKSNGAIYWPGTDIVIEETKDGNLKVSFEKILTICKYPPKPDAICRFENCLGVKKSIYCNDTDYKGYVRIKCTDACLVEYHIQCWKKLKSKFADKSTDKDFLDTCCFTSSCLGHVGTIQVYDTDGLKTEVQTEKPKHKKEKPEKVATTEVTAGSKKKKRSKKKEKETPNEVEVKQNDVETREEQKYDVTDEMPPIDVPEQDEKQPTKGTDVETQCVEDLSKIPESGMFVLKKSDDDQQLALPIKQAKGKNKKKKTKNVQSLDEFLGRDNEHLRLRPYQHGDDCEDYDEIPSQPFIRQPPEGWMSEPFSIPAHLQHEAREIESSLATFSHNNMYLNNDPWKKDSIREYVYSAFINLLKAEGSLHVTSEPMRKLLNIMPEEARILVQKEGGLRDFLAKSCLFTIEADIVTNFEDKLITDLSKPYKKPQDPAFITPVENGIARLEEIATPDGIISDTNTGGKFGPVGSLDGALQNRSPTSVVNSLQNISQTSVVNTVQQNNFQAGVGNILQENISLASTESTLQQNCKQKIDFPLPSFSREECMANLSNYGNVNKETVNSSVKTDTWFEKGGTSSEWPSAKAFVPYDVKVPSKESVITETNEIDKISGKNMDTETSREIATNTANGLDKEINENINKILNDDFDLINISTDKATNAAENNGDSDAKDSTARAILCESSDAVPIVNELELKNESEDTVKNEVLDMDPAASTLSLEDSVVSETKIDKKTNDEQTESIPITVPNDVLVTREIAVSVEPKLTKEKYVQAKPSTKTKIIMTEAMNEPFKADYEKLLRSCQSWESKYQELLDKNIQMEKKYGTDVISMEKKLQECGHKLEILSKECQHIQKHHDHDLNVLRQEKREKTEQIKKLQEQLTSISESEEKQVKALKDEICALESQHEKEKQQWLSEKESAEKMKSYSQQQARRASNAEVQLLELQRDVNFSFFTRALQEAELTVHNISQILTVNSTPQLQEISQKWQRYIAECKLQLGRNKIMFEASIPQIKEGKPLSSLTSLRIARPASYPGPPILHLPPGAIPVTGNKQMPGLANIRPEAKRGPSPTPSGGASGRTTPGATTVVRNDPVRPAVQAEPTNETPNSSIPERPIVAEAKKGQEQPQKGSNSFEKIMMRLSTLFPNYSRTQMTNFIKEVRASKNGSLTGLSFDDIVACVTKLVKTKERQAGQAVAPVPPNEAGASGYSVPKTSGGIQSKPAAPITRSISLPAAKPVKAVPSVLGSISLPSGIPLPVSNNVNYEDDPCVICHDEMTTITKNVSLDCGHSFHHDCIKKWLTGEQSTCPTCRVHALLPEEFPQLK
ncbi:E3 ubiquitin-protein ligase TTC3-like [Dendronephthya gigantea]|uniref:E3 ubiquitin-protein ligase TTC3-like n=1 Tax=Dendronephthya gigantea TaxID=151771 RepID=UPI00106AC4AC|nr:E3 ubiquitin-protein ligase TTC3-like [Dendronephthya gigantea]